MNDHHTVCNEFAKNHNECVLIFTLGACTVQDGDYEAEDRLALVQSGDTCDRWALETAPRRLRRKNNL